MAYLFGSAIVLFVIVTVLLFNREVGRIRAEKAERLASTREIPDFGLTDQFGQIVRRRDLIGKVWMAGLVRFSDDRPGAAVDAMSLIVSRVATIADYRAVLISIDPEADTPDQLERFVSLLPNKDKWVALTGKPDRVADLVRVGLGRVVRKEGHAVRIERSDWIGVVDRKGRLRASFDATGNHFQEQALTALKHVLSEQ